MKTHLNQVWRYFVQWFKHFRWVWLISSILAVVSVIGFSGVRAIASPPRAVTFFGSPSSSISAGVAVPRYASYFFTSGLVPRRLPDGTYSPSTFDQAVDILQQIQELLAQEGLSLSDVIYINAYLTADPATGKADYRGWFDAYAQFFNNQVNPVKTARVTMEAASLVLPDWRIEISAIAVYPRK